MSSILIEGSFSFALFALYQAKQYVGEYMQFFCDVSVFLTLLPYCFSAVTSRLLGHAGKLVRAFDAPVLEIASGAAEIGGRSPLHIRGTFATHILLADESRHSDFHLL